MGRLLTALQRIQSRSEDVRLPAPAAEEAPQGTEPLWPSDSATAWLQHLPFALPVETENLLDQATAALEGEAAADAALDTESGDEENIPADWIAQPPAEESRTEDVAVTTPLPPVVALISETKAELTAENAISVAAGTIDDSVEGPVVSLRLPGFGRPQDEVQAAAPSKETRHTRRPPSVPFLPPTQRPYRSVCENILAALPEGRSSALVLGWIDGDLDHSALSAKLAEVMANRLDDPVLLIDVGASHRLTSLMRIPAEGSLCDALAGQIAWRDQIVQTDTAGLCLLPSAPGDFAADPVAVARLIEACKEDFAMVLLMGEALAEYPENLLSAADAGVVLVEAGHTPVPAATQGLELLRRNGLEVLGCVITGQLGGV